MMFLSSIFIFTTFPLTCVICDKKISVKSTVSSELNLGTSLLCERYTLYLSLNDPFRFGVDSLFSCVIATQATLGSHSGIGLCPH